ncbi:MAG: recombinase family protein [Lachnospiraceae bacterium]|nr:recombinase family protein [Lachnospiraceae bacterium]
MKVWYIPRLRDMRKKRVAAYCRVSSRKEEQEESLEAQMAYYSRLIQNNDDWEFVAIYSDEKSATTADKRDGFQQMIQDALEGKLDLILIKSISRFSRNIVDCQNYARILEGYGVELRFEKEHLSTSDPDAKMMFGLLGSVAQSESQTNSERTKWSIHQRMARGEYIIGSNRILGYDCVDGKLVPSTEAWMIRMIFELFLQGKSYRQISDELYKAGGHCLRSEKPLQHANIRHILQNETYVGDKHLQKQAPVNFITKRPENTAEYQSIYRTDDHEGIIDRHTWNQAQLLLKRQEEERQLGVRTAAARHHFLYGKVFCLECGAPFTRRTLRSSSRNPKSAYKAWSCRERLKGGKGNGCKNMVLREKILLEKICAELGWEWSGEGAFDGEKFRKSVEKVEVRNDEIKITKRREEDEEKQRMES